MHFNLFKPFIYFLLILRLSEFENGLQSGDTKLHDDVQRAAQELVDSLVDPKIKNQEVSWEKKKDK